MRISRDDNGQIEDEYPCPSALKMQQLASSFHSLRGLPGIDPWDAYHLASKSIHTVSSSARQSLLFVLTVWNPEIPECFDLEPFDIHHALKIWDVENHSAFLTWAKNPWWA